MRYLLIWTLLLLAACEAEGPQVKQIPSNRTTTTIGAHELHFTLPNGWQHLNQGSTHAIRHAGTLLEFEDLGTFSWFGIKSHIKTARELFADGDALAAQEKLKQLPQLQALFLNTDEWHKTQHLWHLLTHRQLTEDKVEVLASYDSLLRTVAYQPEIEFAAVTNRLLALEDRHNQREIAQRKSLMISGRDAIQVKTWDKLSHTMQLTYLYVLNGDNILLLSVKLGAYDIYAPVFDEIVASMEFD